MSDYRPTHNKSGLVLFLVIRDHCVYSLIVCKIEITTCHRIGDINVPIEFNILKRLQEIREKQAFTPSPMLEQMVMQQAQQGGGGPPGGLPPGMDPSQMAAMAGGGPPPGMDPAAAGGAPPADPAAGPPQAPGGVDPNMIAQIVQQTLAAQQQQGGAGGAGGTGKGGGKQEHMMLLHHIKHDMQVMKAVQQRLADALGIQIPASEVLSMQPPAPTPPSDPAQQGGGGGQSPQADQMASQIASQLPTLPPVASKSASTRQILDAGYPADDIKPSRENLRAAKAAFLTRKKWSSR